MNIMIYFFLVVGYVCLLIWGFNLTKDDGLWILPNVLLLVIFGLIYDNLMFALGKFIGKGSLLESLSFIRYWLHTLFTPTLILFAWSICFKVDLSWTTNTLWKVLAFLFSVGLIFYELFTSLIRIELKPKWEHNVLTYEAVTSQSPVMVTLITIVLAIVGFILLKNFQFSWLLFGTIVMIAGSFLDNWFKSFPIMNILEFVLILSLIKTRRFQIQNQQYKW